MDVTEALAPERLIPSIPRGRHMTQQDELTPVHERLRGSRLGTLHQGKRYAFGFGPDFYGIWDVRSPGSPVERFPATSAGRSAGWERYVTLEPSAQELVPPWMGPEAGATVVRRPRGLRRWGWLVATAAVAAGVGVFVAIQRGGGEGGRAAGGGAAVAEQAHVEISGAVALVEDLSQESFDGSTLESLLPRVEATWAGERIQLLIRLSSPEIGRFETSENPHRRLELTFLTDDGTGTTITSLRRECAITLETLDPTEMSGSFECTGLKLAGPDEMIDVQGTFSAGA